METTIEEIEREEMGKLKKKEPLASPVERPGYVAVCERCKFIRYEDRSAYCGQGHWYGDDDPNNPPKDANSDPWTDCEDLAT